MLPSGGSPDKMVTHSAQATEWNNEEGLLPRRAWLAQQLRRSAGVVAGLAGAGTWQQAQAGAQKEEYLADSVRTALSSAIAYSAPPVPVFFDRKSEMEYRYWLTSMSQRLGNRMAAAVNRTRRTAAALPRLRLALLHHAAHALLPDAEMPFRLNPLPQTLPMAQQGFMRDFRRFG